MRIKCLKWLDLAETHCNIYVLTDARLYKSKQIRIIKYSLLNFSRMPIYIYFVITYRLKLLRRSNLLLPGRVLVDARCRNPPEGRPVWVRREPASRSIY